MANVKKLTAKSMYCNLETSWRNVATFRIWGKRPGYPVYGWMGSAEARTQYKAGRMWPEFGLQGVSKGNNFKLQFRRESLLWREQCAVQRAVC